MFESGSYLSQVIDARYLSTFQVFALQYVVTVLLATDGIPKNVGLQLPFRQMVSKLQVDRLIRKV